MCDAQKAQPEDGDEKVDEHDWRDEDVDTEHYQCQPRPSWAARHTRVIQIHSAVVAAALNVALQQASYTK